MFKNNTFSVLHFLIVFLLLTIAFYSYVGVVSPGGKAYSPFLDHYANFPAALSYFISKSAKSGLQLAGYDVYQKAPNNVTIRGSHGVTIIWACLGFGVMSFWLAFVWAHRAKLGYKIKWAAAGVCLITAINIIRIDSIALANYYRWKTYQFIEPHFAFTVVSYIAIFLLTVYFIRNYRKSGIRAAKVHTPSPAFRK